MKKRTSRINGFMPVLFLIIAAVSSSCQKKEVSESAIMMDTFVEIKLPSENRYYIGKCFDKIKGIESLFNIFSENSELGRISSSAGIRPEYVSADTIEILTKTLKLSRITNGVFDPTILPVIKLWKNNPEPDPQRLKRALSLVGYDKISISGSNVFLPLKGMMLDLGGVAKGYACDKAADFLKSSGVKYGLINAGGDITCFGPRVWKIGIQHPRIKDKIFVVLQISGRSIATSGDYERFTENNGRRYNHIFDPRTGAPADKSISATVIAEDGVTADILATTVSILGPVDGLKLLESFPGTEGIVVDPEGNVFCTKGIESKVKLKKI